MTRPIRIQSRTFWDVKNHKTGYRASLESGWFNANCPDCLSPDGPWHRTPEAAAKCLNSTLKTLDIRRDTRQN